MDIGESLGRFRIVAWLQTVMDSENFPDVAEHGDNSMIDSNEDRRLPRRVGVLVLGMHRAGTSALTRMLNLLGCALPHTLLGANETNPAGHWESDRIWRFNDELLAQAGSKWDDWAPISDNFFTAPGYPDLISRGAEQLREEFGEASLFVFKDPRNSRLARFWLDVFAAEAIHPAVVIPIRNPLEVARSLAKRNNADEHYGALLWLRHVLEAEAASRSTTRVFTSYEQLVECWELVAGRLQQGLGITWPRMSATAQEEIGAFIDKRHRREAVAPELIEQNTLISDWLRRTWAILHSWAVKGENGEDYAELDAIRRALNEAAPAFARLILRGDQARHQAKALEFELATAQAQLADMVTQSAEQLHNQHEMLKQESAQAFAEGAALRGQIDELTRSREAAENRENSLESANGDLLRLLGEAQAKADAASEQLRDAGNRLTGYADRVAEQDSALLQRREENEQAWSALSLEQAASADLRDQLGDFAEREETQRQRLAEAEAWVFRLAGERSAAELQRKKDAKLLKRQAHAVAADSARLHGLESTEARLKERTEDVVTLSQMFRQAELRAVAAEAEAARSKEALAKQGDVAQLLQQAQLRAIAAEAESVRSEQWAAKYREIDTRLHIVLSEQMEAEGRLRERFSEVAQLTTMMRGQENENRRQKRYMEWLRQISATLATRPRWWALMPKAWLRQRESRRLKRRGLFDADAYLSEHPDVGENGMDPLRHYLLHGYAEGRLPTSALLSGEDAGQ